MIDENQNEIQLFKFYIDTQFLPFCRTYKMRSVIMEFSKFIDEYLEEETEKKTVHHLMIYLTMKLGNRMNELLERLETLDT